MIVLKNLTKVFSLYGHKKTVANNINATFPSGVSVGLLGRNGAGKSTLLKLIAGTTHPTSGQVLSDGSVSFPVGLASSLHPDLTGAQNTRFVARIYGADTDALLAYVEEFAELGHHFHLPIRSYSSGMKGRISFGINMGLKFDTYLIDEVTAVGDASFKRKSRDIFLDRMRNSGAIFVSHSMGTIRELCTAGAFLEDGRLSYYPEVEDAIEHYMSTLDGPGSYFPGADLKDRIPFPYDARMLFGIGMSQTRIDWLGDCLRRHRPCHFSKTRDLHYFDTRAGLFEIIPERRFKTTQQLATRLQQETGAERRNSLRLLGDVSALVTIHADTEETGPDRHKAYLDYLLADRKAQPVVCDFTPDYALLTAEAFREMALIGQGIFTCVLRDPARRLWAQIWESLPGRRRTEEACIEAARHLIATPEKLADYPAADYVRLFSELEEAMVSPGVFWLFHENLTEQEALRPFCDFLDIPTVPKISLPPLPEASEPPMPPDIGTGLRVLLAQQYEACHALFGEALPASWGQDSDTLPGQEGPMPPEERRLPQEVSS